MVSTLVITHGTQQQILSQHAVEKHYSGTIVSSKPVNKKQCRDTVGATYPPDQSLENMTLFSTGRSCSPFSTDLLVSPCDDTSPNF